jgi:inhibitor of KinA sporulation pathway (predicted exonuclease)
MNKIQKYLALDLELNNARDGSTPNPKIIQVGIAWGSFEDYINQTIETKKWYIDPQESIYPEITELTGISNGDIESYSVSHETVASDISNIINTHNTFINPVTWGGGDSVELLSEFREKQIVFPHFGRRWIDVKTWFIYNQISLGLSVTGGLSKTMHKYGIQFKGTPHRADIDAFNTLRLFMAMAERQYKMEMIIRQSKMLP